MTDTHPGVGVSYGFRFARYLQAGVGAVYAKYRTDTMVSPVAQVPQNGWGYYLLVRGRGFPHSHHQPLGEPGGQVVFSFYNHLARYCTTCYSTRVIPFRLTFQPGIPVHEQVTFAAKKALISGLLRPGDPFPSVRALSKALKINPNTAHKVVTQLTQEGLLEVRPGIGTAVARPPAATRAERSRVLGREVEQLAVEALKLGLALEDVQAALAEQWRRLDRVEHAED